MDAPPPPTVSRSPSFEQEIVVVPDEIDELGHVSNIAYVRWVQEIAKAHSRAVGWTRPRYAAIGCVWVVRKHEVEYLYPAFEGDRLRLVTWVEGWRGVSSERKTRVVRAADDKELARATTLWVLVTAAAGKPTRIPPSMREDFLATPGPDPLPWRPA